MNRFLSFPYYIWIFLWAVSVSLPAALLAQQPVPLREVLSDIEALYDVRFSYKAAVVRPISVKKPVLQRSKSLPLLLKEILHPVRLDFTHLRGKYYAIVPLKAPLAENLPKDAPPAGAIIPSHIRALVLDQTTYSPLAHASIELLELGLKSQTSLQGEVTFSRLPEGTYTLSAQYIGYQEARFSIATRPQTSSDPDTLFLVPANLSVDAVQVTARESRGSDLSTTSTIERLAMEHIQPTSLADVLQLLPGQLAHNPNLTAVNKVALRQINTDNVGSLGTSVLVNGVPLSNNANMQFNHSARSGTLANYATTAGAGIDFRQISADNIESVEVIRGIPSVAHGDLTSGAIIVKTRAGKYPLQLKSRINPTLTQFAAGQGFQLPRQHGTLNIDLDYTKAVSDQRFSVNTFNRYTANLLHQRSFGSERPLRTQTGFSYSANIGQHKPDPDDPDETSNRASDYAYRFYTTGQWQAQRKFARTVAYSLSADFTHQRSYQQERQSGGFPIVQAMSEGLSEAVLVSGSYLSQLWVDGKPMNLYAKISNKFFLQSGSVRHSLLMGAEWRSSHNFGKGQQYDFSRPPAQHTGPGTRPRPFRDIPPLHHLSLYVEDHAGLSIGARKLDLQFGLRYDNVQPRGLFSSRFDHVLAPRVNGSITLLPGLEIRAGYGLAAKSPTLAYLSPQPAYFDAISLNHTAENPAERLVLVTTSIFPSENKELRMAVNRKKELGLRWRIADKQVSLTAYHEHTINGYDYQKELSSFRVLNIPQYSVVERPVGQRPVVSDQPTGYRTYFADYYIPNNGRELINKGVEFDLDFGRIDAINTSFLLNGALMSSENVQSTFYLLQKLQTSDIPRQRVGIYPKGRGKEDVRFNTTVRMVHHIPRFRLIASLMAQTVWIDQNSYIGYEKNALGYLSIHNNAPTWLSQDERELLDPVADEDIILSIDDAYYVTESWKPIWQFNFRLTKEIGDHVLFSFYANNVFFNRPLRAGTRYPNRFERRNSPLFFGLELNIKLFNQ